MVANRKTSFVLSTVSVFFALTLIACSDSPQEAGETHSAQDKAKSVSGSKISLSMDPIDLATAQAPETAASRQVPVCPWLSDASANAAVDNILSTEPMLRRAVTPNECKWNLNLGFAFRVSAVPLAEAVSPSSVTYNMDNAPVLEPQNGPGSDAVALLDATWNADNPRPFAFIFNADDRQFKITTTGVKTSIERLRVVADEIVGSLSNTASVPDVRSAEATLDPCVYDGVTLAALFGGASSDSLSGSPNITGSSCKYSGIIGDSGIELTIQFSGDPLVPPNTTEPEYELLKKFGADIYFENKPRTTSYGSSSRVYQIGRTKGRIRIDMLVGGEAPLDDAAEQLLENLIARTN